MNVQFFSEKGNPLIKSWGKSSQKRTCAFEFAKKIFLFGDAVLKYLLTAIDIFSGIPDLRTKGFLKTIGSTMILALTQDCIKILIISYVVLKHHLAPMLICQQWFKMIGLSLKSVSEVIIMRRRTIGSAMMLLHGRRIAYAPILGIGNGCKKQSGTRCNRFQSLCTATTKGKIAPFWLKGEPLSRY